MMSRLAGVPLEVAIEAASELRPVKRLLFAVFVRIWRMMFLDFRELEPCYSEEEALPVGRS